MFRETAQGGEVIGLQWTHPARYGTHLEQATLLWLFNSGFAWFCLLALGEAIKVYKLNDYSWIQNQRAPVTERTDFLAMAVRNNGGNQIFTR
jgi:hypothetical protein